MKTFSIGQQVFFIIPGKRICSGRVTAGIGATLTDPFRFRVCNLEGTTDLQDKNVFLNYEEAEYVLMNQEPE